MSLMRAKPLMIILVMAILVAIPCVSCAGDGAPPPEEPPEAVAPDSILIPVSVDLSGPYGAQNQLVINGLTDGLGYVNDQGGVKGVPLEFAIRDSAGKVENAVTILNEFLGMSPRPAMTAFLDSHVLVALKDRFVEEKVVNIGGAALDSGLYPSANSFAIYTEYGDMFGFFCDWLVEKEAPNKPKLAILTWDNVVGNVVLEDRCLNYAKSKGIEIVAMELFNVSDTTVADQLQKIKDSGAEWVYTNTLLIGPSRINNDAMTLGLTDTFKFGMCGIGLSYNTMGLGRGMEGWVGPNTHASFEETSIPGMQVLMEQFEKNERKRNDRQNVYVASFVGSLLMQQGFETVVDQFGWGGITGENMKRVFVEMKDFDTMGLAKINYSEELRHPLYMKMYEMKEGQILPLTDWRKGTHLK